MKNKLFMIVIGLFLVFLFPLTAKGYGLCTSKRYSNLKSIAYRTNVSYELKFDEKHNHYFEVTATNVSKDVLIKFNKVVYEPKKDNDTIIINTRLEGGRTYEFNIYGGYDTDCSEEFLYTKKLAIPKYNIYSEREECIEYEEFELCKKWYQGYISDENEFKEKLEIYKNSLKKEEEKEEKEEEKNIIEKIIEFYKENIKITLPITIIIGILIIIKIVITIVRRRKRIKLDS